MRRVPRVLAWAVALLTVTLPAWSTEVSVRVISPSAGARVTGTVGVTAATGGEATEVVFDWSADGGERWLPIATDVSVADGWTASWSTAPYEGPAVLRVRATDGATHAQDVVLLTVDNGPLVALSVSPTVFSPNGDGRNDSTEISVGTNQPATIVARVRDAAGRLIATWTVTQRSPGTARVRWSGRRPDRTAYLSGAYRLEATATDDGGHSTSAWGAVVLDNVPPALAWSRSRPDPAPAGRNVSFRFGTWDRATQLVVTMTVLDGWGVSLTAPRTVTVPRGATALWWRAADVGARRLAPGRQWVELRVADDAGNVRRARLPWRITRPGQARVWRRIEGAGRRVALTFDDCYDAAGWRRVLGVLERYHVHATFFCTGQAVRAAPGLARRTVAAGHAIGSHGYDHAMPRGRGVAFTRRRIAHDDAIWWSVARATAAPYYRPPYGAYDRAVLDASGRASCTRVIMWDVDPRDWQRPGAAVVARRVTARARPGSIVVMHAITETAAALPRIISGLRARGLVPASIPEMLRAAGSR